ncbi:thioredoxin family protein [Rurimicrobium arvi]|uniref:Thioredoxin family protein n=1 Tax=Rurimicrobium arvi TaxID=2049916 RepID=A0ABP8MZS4_9BACT
MTFQEYTQYFETLLHKSAAEQNAPYNNPDYLEYTKLNWARMHRWLKTAHIEEALSDKLKEIAEKQYWIVITEPWCGDAAHSVPFIEMAAAQNPLIRISYELRDSEPFRIEQYLTHGSKSIPKLIIRNEAGEDLAVWGPRPAGCQQVYDELKAANADFGQMKTAIQQWYNKDKGQEIQRELAALDSFRKA